MLKEVLRKGLANAVLQAWTASAAMESDVGTHAPGTPPPNMRKDLHFVLKLRARLGVPLPVAAQASHTADAGVATGHGDARL